MTDFRLCAFADEAAPSLDGQIEALRRNGIKLIEIRNIDGRSVLDMSNEELLAAKAKLDAAGIKVWSIGSSVGKTKLSERDEHERRFGRALAVAGIFETKNVRMFSFFVDDEEAESQRDAIIAELERMSEVAAAQGVRLCHENEKGIYGSTAARTLELLEKVPNLHGVFDPANFIQCGEKPGEIFADFAPHTDYMHIKDALAVDGTVVPAGEGDGNISKLLKAYCSKGSGRVLTLEPHLFEFVGLGKLQDEKLKHKKRYADAGEAFDAAANSLKKLLKDGGYSYE